jgi:hypothetical protein
MASIRGGTGVWFLNTMTGSVAGCNFDLVLDNVRSAFDDPIDTFGFCDGTHTGVDQNTAGQSGWRCRDQIGISHDLSQWDITPSILAWNQNSKPAYIWGNTKGGSPADEVGGISQGDNNPIHIVANRDVYFTSAATGSPQTVGVRTGTLANRPAACTAGVAYWCTTCGKWRKDTSAEVADGALFKCTATDTWTAYYIPHPYPHPWVDGNTSFASDIDFVEGQGGGGGSSPSRASNAAIRGRRDR